MGPLEDLSLGHSSRNGNTEGPHRSLTSLSSSPAAQNRSEKQGKGLQSTASLQGMLHNDTDTGLSNFLVSQQTYKPPSALKLGGSEDFLGLPAVHAGKSHQRGPQDQENIPLRHVTEPGGSPSAVTRLNPRQAPYLSFRNHAAVEEYRSWSSAQRSQGSQGFPRHPHQMVPHQSRGIGPNGRPRSPYAYPTRLKRPGYRPSSPAWSDINQPAFNSGPLSRAVSPASVHSVGYVPLPSQRSDPMLMHYPPYLAQGNTFSHHPSPHLGPAAIARTNSGLHGVRGQRSLSNLRQRSPPASPIFYDYSEQFEETCSPRAHLPNKPSPKDATHRSLDMQRTAVMPSPAPEKCLRDALEVSIQGARQTKSLPARTPNNQKSSNNEASKRFTFTPTRYAERTNELVDLGLTLQPLNDYPDEQRKSIGSSIGKANTSYKRSSKDKNYVDFEDYAESSSSAGDSMRTAGSGPTSNDSVHDKTSEQSDSPENLHVELPGVQIVEAENVEPLENITRQDAKSEDHSESESTEIVSPTPERSILSSNNRHRFSKILGLDDNSLMGENVDYRASRSLHNLHKSTCQLPESASKGPHNEPTERTTRLEDSDSDDALQLSPSFMKTFGRLTHKETQVEGVDSYNSDLVNSDSTSKNPLHASKAALSKASANMEENDGQVAALSAEGLELAVFQSPTGNNRNYQIIAPREKRDHVGIHKELCSVPEDQPAVVAIPPPSTTEQVSLPFAFTPLKQQLKEAEKVLQLGGDTATTGDVSVDISNSTKQKSAYSSPGNALQTEDTGKFAERESLTSSRSSRPWNRNSNYPWNDESINLDVAFPAAHESTPTPLGRIPRFKLRINRASTSSAGTGIYTKSRSSSEVVGSHRDSGNFLTQKAISKLKGKQKAPIGPGQENSSHVIRDETLRSRFVESFDAPPQLDTIISSPTITLLPPSPGHEARSFFSDDSSQVRQKGSLRKRLSDFKSRRSQTNSTDEIRGHDHGLLNSAFGRSRASGRNSRQSQTTAGGVSYKSHIQHVRFRMLRTVRTWWHRSEDRVRDWKQRFYSRQ